MKKKITTTFPKGQVVTAAMMMDVLSSGNPNDEVRIENTWSGKPMRVTLISDDTPQGATLDSERDDGNIF